MWHFGNIFDQGIFGVFFGEHEADFFRTSTTGLDRY
jgi:hypothetical protein